MCKPLIALVCFAVAGCATAANVEVEEKEEIGPLPSVKEFKSGSARFFGSDLKQDFEFDITEEDWKSIRAALIPAKRDSNPAKWQSLGSLDITKDDGNVFAIELYATGKDPGAFSVRKADKKRIYYRGGTTSALTKALKAAYEKSQKKKSNAFRN